MNFLYSALKDMVQNHLLQILALIAMDKPKNLGPEAIRDEKVKVLKSLKPLSKRSIGDLTVRGQYQRAGDLLGYVQEIGRPSETETFVALKGALRLKRWKDVPFSLRTGKRLSRKVTEVSVHFKQQDHNLFEGRTRFPNVLTFRIQPNEQVRLQINNKIPGFGINLHAGSLEFGYAAAFQVEIPGAYERLLLDFMEDDQRLFIRSDEIEAAWKFVDSISLNWNDDNAPLHGYRAGSPGPKAAADLVARDGYAWWTS